MDLDLQRTVSFELPRIAIDLTQVGGGQAAVGFLLEPLGDVALELATALTLGKELFTVQPAPLPAKLGWRHRHQPSEMSFNRH